MTGQELFNETIGMMGLTTSNAVTYVETAVPQINTLLGQLFDLENNLREKNEEDKLTEIPAIFAISDVLPYKESINRRVLKWGLAQLFALSDDDTVKATYYGAVFAETYKEYSKNIVTEVHDYFGGDSEW